MIILGITGTLGAGKGTVVDYLVSKKRFKHFSVRNFLKEELDKKGLEANRDNMQQIANEIRQNNAPDFITQKLFEQASATNHDSIIESIRNPKEAEFIKSQGGYLIAVDADQKVRYERISKRASETDSVTFEKFVEQEEKERNNTDPNAQNLDKCIEMADFKITNDESVEKLHEKVEEIITKIKS